MNTLRLFKLHYNSIPKAFLFFKQSFSDYISVAQAENLPEREKECFHLLCYNYFASFIEWTQGFSSIAPFISSRFCILLHMKTIEHILLSQTTNGIKRRFCRIATLGRGLDYGEM